MTPKDKHFRALAIVNAYEVPPSIDNVVDRMKEELGKLGIALERKTNAEIFAYVGPDGNLCVQNLPYDFILYLDKDRYIAQMLEKAGYRLFNSAKAIELCDDKMLTYLQLSQNGIPMPKTISGPLNYSTHDDGEFLTNLQSQLKYPMVVKTNFGSQGKGVYLAANYAELQEIEKAVSFKPRLYQECILASFGQDYRLVVINHRFVAGYKRESQNGDFRSNLGQGGTGAKHTMSAAQIRLAEKASEILGLDYCGIDLLDSGDPDRPILCEVNSNAFMKGIESVTGVNVAQIYAAHIYQTIYR